MECNTMATVESQSTPAIPTEILAEIAIIVDRLVKRIRDPEAMRLVVEEMNSAREGLRTRSGEMDGAVDLVRGSRVEP
jgi:hypothetical protein